jgi:hypothetical protein
MYLLTHESTMYIIKTMIYILKYLEKNIGVQEINFGLAPGNEN